MRVVHSPIKKFRIASTATLRIGCARERLEPEVGDATRIQPRNCRAASNRGTAGIGTTHEGLKVPHAWRDAFCSSKVIHFLLIHKSVSAMILTRRRFDLIGGIGPVRSHSL
jgi:hypothetical protein